MIVEEEGGQRPRLYCERKIEVNKGALASFSLCISETMCLENWG